MWPKEDYQEHMLGYLDGVRIEFERLLHVSLQRYDLNEFYAVLDNTSERLWRLIEASDTDWEEYRDPLEASCDELLWAIRQLPNDTSISPLSSFMLTGVRVVQLEPKPFN